MKKVLLMMLAVLTGTAVAQMTWTCATESAPWGIRAMHASVIFRDSVWLMGGWGSGEFIFHDIWCGRDGVHWIQKADAEWSQRYAHSAVANEDGIWVMGGGTNTGVEYGDVWHSPDGDTWIEENPSAPWGPRRGHASVAFGGRIWVLGGRVGSPSQFLNDVWSSADGAIWVCETAAAAWPPRSYHAATVYGGRIWVFGGGSHGRHNDVWYSADGKVWNCATPGAPWSPRLEIKVVVMRDTMWLTGGRDSADVRSDVWYSTDGANWACATQSAEWPPRSSHTMIVAGGRLWIHGGLLDFNGTTLAEDAWCSSGIGGIEEAQNAKEQNGRLSSVGLVVTIVRGALIQPESAGYKIGAASLLNSAGRKVMEIHPGANDVGPLAPGVYFLRSASSVERGTSHVTKVIATR